MEEIALSRTHETMLAEGDLWRVRDLVCTAGPRDRPFEERHEEACIAAVLGGSFAYRSTHGRVTLAPGALLLGNAGRCFTCDHEHAAGDRCVSITLAPALLEEIATDIPGLRRAAFAVHRIPPLPATAPALAAIESGTEDWEEIAIAIAGRALALLADAPVMRVGAADERRVTTALGVIAASPAEPHSLAALAARAGLSRYRFLRVFRAVAGVTPHQFVLRTRLHRAAIRLRRECGAISAIAYDEGFGDLSTFNARFRRTFGCAPSAYRRRNAVT